MVESMNERLDPEIDKRGCGDMIEYSDQISGHLLRPVMMPLW